MSNRHTEKHTQIAVVRSLASKLHAAEEAIDLALIKMSELNAELPAARLEAKLSATVGQPAFDMSASAYQSLILCRSQTVQAHKLLADTQKDMGLGTLAMGGLWKLAEKAEDIHEQPLALVSSKAA